MEKKTNCTKDGKGRLQVPRKAWPIGPVQGKLDTYHRAPNWLHIHVCVSLHTNSDYIRGWRKLLGGRLTNRLPYICEWQRNALLNIYSFEIISMHVSGCWCTNIIIYTQLTIILLKSVAVRKLQVAIFARSSREISQTVRIVWQYILSRVCVSVRPSVTQTIF